MGELKGGLNVFQMVQMNFLMIDHLIRCILFHLYSIFTSAFSTIFLILSHFFVEINTHFSHDDFVPMLSFARV